MNLNSSPVELKEFLISIIGSAPYGILAIDINGRVSMVNTLASKHLFKGAKVSNLLGVQLSDRIRPIYLLFQLLESFSSKGRRDFDLEKVEVGEKFFAIYGRKIVDGMTIVTVDITDQVKNEMAIKSMNEELEMKVRERTAALKVANENLEAFASSVSHDLKNPITSIIGYIQLLQSESETLKNEQKLYLEKIYRTAKKMTHLVDNMLDLSVISTKTMKLQRVNFSALCQEIVNSLQESDPNREADVTIEENCFMYADENLLTIATTNLISNAWKYSGKKKQTIISIGKHDAETFYVKDNGIGFDMNSAYKIFDSYERLEGAREFNGMGIGLSIVKRIVDSHQGKIWVESEQEKGTIFYVKFPLDERLSL